MTLTYRKGCAYLWAMASGGTELALYLGKKNGMHRFLLSGGHVWTGYVPPVMGAE